MRETFLTGIFLFWLVLAGIATAFVAVRGIEWPIVAIAAGLCIFPVITTLPVAHGGRHWPRAPALRRGLASLVRRRLVVLVCAPSTPRSRAHQPRRVGTVGDGSDSRRRLWASYDAQ